MPVDSTELSAAGTANQRVRRRRAGMRSGRCSSVTMLLRLADVVRTLPCQRLGTNGNEGRYSFGSVPHQCCKLVGLSPTCGLTRPEERSSALDHIQLVLPLVAIVLSSLALIIGVIGQIVIVRVALAKTKPHERAEILRALAELFALASLSRRSIRDGRTSN
jgi:hypothetical protein